MSDEGQLPWWDVLTIGDPAAATERDVARAYRAFARESGGDEAELRLLNRARDEAMAFLRRCGRA